ncbi:ABC transporter permease [uncultured Ruminococcus sp.]|uniref:ABC transporter permease n=1 Tax=uncultured Ruminococcus sp. TaxID=165186 RepID=UPI0037DD5029
MNAKLRSTISKVAPRVGIFLLILAIWYCVCRFTGIPKFILPSPGDVIGAFRDDWKLMLSHARVTLTETMIGLFVGILIGFLTAVLMDRFALVRKTVYPLIVVSQTIPTVAIAPMLVIWMGYEMLPKIVLIVLVVFFPIAISLLQGFSEADKDTVNLMRSMGANRMQIFRYVKLPNSLGHFFSSLKISVSYAVVSAVVSEWIGGTEGLGCYMTRVRKSFASDKMFAVIILISVISLILIWLTELIQHACMPWEKAHYHPRRSKE